MKILSYLPRITLAALFAAGSSTAVLATIATHAGAPASGLFAAAPVAALADPDDRRRHRDDGDRRSWDRNRGNGYAGDDRNRDQGWNNNGRNNNNGWDRNNGWNGNNGQNGDNGRGNRDSNRRDNDDHRDRDRR